MDNAGWHAQRRAEKVSICLAPHISPSDIVSRSKRHIAILIEPMMANTIRCNMPCLFQRLLLEAPTPSLSHRPFRLEAKSQQSSSREWRPRNALVFSGSLAWIHLFR